MLLTLFSAVFLIFLIYNPALCTLGATKGLSLWYKQVLPALFPAMAAASFLISRKSVQAALKHLPFPSGAAFLSGLLCGSPMGALTCSGLYASKLLSQTGSSVDCLLCSAAKPTIFVWLCRICFACAAYKNAFCFSFMCLSAFFRIFFAVHASFSLKIRSKTQYFN